MSLCAVCCCKNRIFYFWTNRQITWTRKPSRGSNSICRNTKARLSPSRTIDIFSIMSRAGFWNLIAAKAFRIREIIRRGLNKNKRVLHSEQKGEDKRRRLWSANWNGFGCRRKVATRNRKRESTITKNLLSEESKNAAKRLEIFIPPGERLGDIVIEAHGCFKGLRRQTACLKIWNFLCRKAESSASSVRTAREKRRFFVLLPNRKHRTDSGDFKVGETVKLGYVDQSRDSLNADKTILDEISDGLDLVLLGKREMNSRAYVSRFNFSGADQQKRVGQTFRRRAQPRSSGENVKNGRECYSFGRTDQRSGCQHDACVRRSLENFGGCAVVIATTAGF